MDTGVLSSATAQAVTALAELEQLLGAITDADLHRAEPNGGWTGAQVVSHIHMCSLIWIADLERLRLHPEPHMFLFREELGHDVTGAPPPSTDEAAARVASARVAIERSFPTVSAAVLAKTVEIPTLGTFSVADFMPIISGHLAGHVEQFKTILRSRGVLAQEVA
jgi:DinB superfamily